MMTADEGTILALDVGGVRIGLALASKQARIASPHGFIANDVQATQALRKLCQEKGVTQLVIGLPRGLEGQRTGQTVAVEEYGADIAQSLGLPLAWQDEAVTSVRAEEELEHRGKPYEKGDIDALAATYILEDYLHGNV